MTSCGSQTGTRRDPSLTLSTQREQDVSQTKHTPGPWTFDRDWRRIPMIFGADGMPVASIEKGITLKGIPVEPHCEANARLIAAAPDLLAAIINSDDAHWTPAMRAAMHKALDEDIP